MVPVPENKVETLYSGTQVGTGSLCDLLFRWFRGVLPTINFFTYPNSLQRSFCRNGVCWKSKVDERQLGYPECGQSTIFSGGAKHSDGGGVGGGHPDPEGGCQVSKNFFSSLCVSVWSKNKGVGPPGPSPRSATDFVTVPGHYSPGTKCEGTLSLLLTSHVNLNSNFRILYGFFLSVYPWPWRRLILLALIILFCLASNKSAYRRIANPAFIFYVFCF